MGWGGLELLIDERGFLQCRGRGRRGLLTVPGLWWAGAMGPDTHFSPPPSGFFSSRGSKGAVVVHSFGVGSIGLTHGSIGLTRWSIGLTVLSGSTPGASGDQPENFGPRTCRVSAVALLASVG